MGKNMVEQYQAGRNLHGEDLDRMMDILKEKYPEFVPYAQRYLSGHTTFFNNMYIMKKELFEPYCAWLFDILFELEARLDISQYDPYSRRVFGFVSERLLDVWITANGLPYREVPCLFTEKVNWPKKIAAFLKRKFRPTY